MNITETLQQLVPLDKAYHIIIGSIIYALCSLFIGYYALVIVFVVAVLKEVFDHYHPAHTADIKDIIATLAGGLIGFVCNFN